MFYKKTPSILASVFLLSSSFVHGFVGDATWYSTGKGSCGAISRDTDLVVALSMAQYQGGSHCWKQIIITSGGKTVWATVVDSCPGCGPDGLDLSQGAFQALAPLDAGRIQVEWRFYAP